MFLLKFINGSISAHQADGNLQIQVLGEVVLGDPASEAVRVHAPLRDAGSWAELRRALQIVVIRFPALFAPVIFPEQLSRQIFEPLGFLRERLNQLLM